MDGWMDGWIGLDWIGLDWIGLDSETNRQASAHRYMEWKCILFLLGHMKTNLSPEYIPSLVNSVKSSHSTCICNFYVYISYMVVPLTIKMTFTFT